MRPAERVIAQLEHRETDFVPYVLPIEEEVGRRLDEYYGDDAYRALKQDHIASAGVTRLPVPPNLTLCAVPYLPQFDLLACLCMDSPVTSPDACERPITSLVLFFPQIKAAYGTWTNPSPYKRCGPLTRQSVCD